MECLFWLQVVYTDGDSEELNLAKERWKLLEDLNSASEVQVSSSSFLFSFVLGKKV